MNLARSVIPAFDDRQFLAECCQFASLASESIEF
jgi:hypothetical protein